MYLTPACIDDIENILSVETESFVQPWRRQALLDELTHPDAFQCVARQALPAKGQEVVVGYIMVRFLLDEMHLMKLAVAPRWRRRGIATDLLVAAQQEASRRDATVILLEVRPSNEAAVLFYHAAGFQIIGRRPNYYPQTGEDALVMLKRLKEES